METALNATFEVLSFGAIIVLVFAGKAVEGGKCRMLRGGQHDQHGGPRTVGVAFSSTEDAFAILPQDLEIAICTCTGPRGWTHLRNPPLGRWPLLPEKVLPEGVWKSLEQSSTHATAWSIIHINY
jgi:hypothetical protein